MMRKRAVLPALLLAAALTQPGAARAEGQPESSGQAEGISAAAPAPAASQEERLKQVVNLSFTNANLKNVLSSLAKIYGLNIVANESVSGTVTLTLRGVTLEEGLRQVLKMNGFGFTVRGEIIEVVRLEQKREAAVIPVKYINLDTALEFLQPMASQGAVLKVDESSNGVLVSDYMSRIEDMRALLISIDQPPQQVLIESKLIDITHTDLDNLGLALSSVALTVPLKSGSLPLDLASGALSLAGPSTDLSGGEVALTVGRGTDTITATLDALIRNQKVKVIANPSVLTLNNVEARIIIGEKFPIREQTQTTTGTLETTRFVDVGTTLRVTPRINRDKYIQMHIHPEVSSVSATLDEGPRITTREADTTVLVKDGQPIVIGGLLQEDETRINGRIPLLGHLPLLGFLFQNRSKNHTQKELVVVITPTLVEAVPELKEPKTAVRQVADRLDVTELFSEAQAWDRNLSLKARQTPETVRSLRAMEVYQTVVDRFPTHPCAMESLWRIGLIARERMNDLDKAEEAFQRLLAQFPKSPHRGSASRQIKGIQWQRARQEGKGKTVKVSTAAGPRRKDPEAPFGFR